MSQALGPYELRGELGRGAMAVVWRAYDPTLDREVALKEPVIAPGTNPDVATELAERFIREGRAAARLNHPGIVTIYSAETYDGRSVIAMELIEGQTLSDLLDSGPLDVAVVVSIVDQLLAAVGYAHAAGVVHRDVKPDNVFITHDGRAKLADFGIAHIGTDATFTLAGSVMGTPGYMAPEQIAGQPVDARADLFAIGVMAHEMLTGRNPFGATDGDAATTVMYRIVHEQMPPVGLRTPAGTDLDAVLAVSAAKNPLDRFPDAGTFRAALVGTVPTAMPPITSTYPGMPGTPTAYSPQPQKAPWLPYAVVGGVGALVLAGLLFASGGVTGAGTAGGGGVSPAPTAVASATVPPVEPAPAPEPVESDLARLITASSSSVLAPGGGADYHPRNLLDGNPLTCWAEGVRGYGEGSWVRFDFAEPVYLTRFGVVAGYDKNIEGWDRWVTNGRLREAEFEFDDGSSLRKAYTDERGLQYVEFDEPKLVRSVTMHVVAAYPGRAAYGHGASSDTSLSEINAMGWTAASVEK